MPSQRYRALTAAAVVIAVTVVVASTVATCLWQKRGHETCMRSAL